MAGKGGGDATGRSPIRSVLQVTALNANEEYVSVGNMAWSHQGPSASVVQNKLGISLALWQPLWMSDTEGIINMKTAHRCLRHSPQLRSLRILFLFSSCLSFCFWFKCLKGQSYLLVTQMSFLELD